MYSQQHFDLALNCSHPPGFLEEQAFEIALSTCLLFNTYINTSLTVGIVSVKNNTDVSVFLR